MIGTVSDDDLSADRFSFGRAKGVLYFVQSDYVEDVKYEDDYRILVLKKSLIFKETDVSFWNWRGLVSDY